MTQPSSRRRRRHSFGTTQHTGTPRSRSTTNIEHVHHYISQNERNEIDSFHCFVRISTMRTGRPTIRASIRRGSARKRPSHRHRRLSHRRGFPSHRARRRPRGDGVEHELVRRVAATELRALAAFCRFCRVAASLDQAGCRSRGAAEVCSCWSWAGVLRELLRRNALALLRSSRSLHRACVSRTLKLRSSLVCL